MRSRHPATLMSSRVFGALAALALAWWPPAARAGEAPGVAAPGVAAPGVAAPGVAADQVLTGRQIEDALTQPKTRSFVPRGLTRRGTAEAQPSVNLNIPFESNSSSLKPQASAQLTQLGLALASASLGNDRFVVAGHTDSRGSPQYNKQLSLRRAEAVKRFLVGRGLDASRLDTVGYGSDQLLEPDRPEDPSNRRVEIRDLGPATP